MTHSNYLFQYSKKSFSTNEYRIQQSILKRDCISKVNGIMELVSNHLALTLPALHHGFLFLCSWGHYPALLDIRKHMACSPVMVPKPSIEILGQSTFILPGNGVTPALVQWHSWFPYQLQRRKDVQRSAGKMRYIGLGMHFPIDIWKDMPFSFQRKFWLLKGTSPNHMQAKIHFLQWPLHMLDILRKVNFHHIYKTKRKFSCKVNSHILYIDDISLVFAYFALYLSCTCYQ